MGFANCSAHALWHEPLPRTLEWMRCPSCGHVHNRSHWTDAGLTEILGKADAGLPAHFLGSLDDRRASWEPVVRKVTELLGGYRALVNRESRPIWVDVGCGDGTLVMTATDHGFAAVGLDIRADTVALIQGLGVNTLRHDFMALKFEVAPDVLSMMDVLQQIPSPLEALRKAAQILPAGGLLIISAPDMTSSSWKAIEAAKVNPYWMELEHHHHFGRERLMALLRECGFESVDFAVPNRYKAQMELYAVRSRNPA